LNKLIVISAPSGGGKTTLCRKLLAEMPELVLSVSSTTRPPRGQEQNGKDYFFLSPEEFQSRVRAKRFAEYALVHGNYYGTSKDVIEAAFAAKKPLLLEIDVQGAKSIREAYPGDTFTVFITPPDMATLEKRLRARGTDSEAVIQKRLENARHELQHAPDFDYMIINDEFERAFSALKECVKETLEQT